MSFARLVAEKLAKGATRVIGIHWGELFPFHYVSEYPKSGGTWTARMIADYLQLPFPQFTIFPIGFSAVIQNHWAYHPKFRRVFYLYRDGRDVIVSFFFDRLREARYSNRPAEKRLRRIYDRLLGKDYRAEDIARLLPKFMDFEYKHPGRGSRLNWRQHIESWYDPDNRPHVAYFSYEELLNDCAGTLGGAIQRVTDKEIDAWRIETTVEKFTMVRQTGRKPGQEDTTQHIRKGVAGDWLNHFTRESAEQFNDLAGDALVVLGYERDRDWVDRYEYVTA
jgi:hypothetical protein